MEHARAELQKIVINALRNAPQEQAPLLAWPVACGPTVAARTRALGFTDGVLRVEVPDRAWKAQLGELVPQYRSVLNQAAKGLVSRIEFVVHNADKKH